MEPPLHGDGGRLDAGLLPGLHVVYLVVKADAREVAGVHPEHHLGPVLGIHPTGASMHAQDGRMVVVLTEVKRFQLQFGDPPSGRSQIVADLRERTAVPLLRGQFRQYLGVLERLVHGFHPSHQALELSQAAAQPRGSVRIVPKIGTGDLYSELPQF